MKRVIGAVALLCMAATAHGWPACDARGVQPPVPVQREAPAYPPAVRANGVEGWVEIALPVADADAAARWWERLGFVPAEEPEPFPRTGLTSDTVDIALTRPGTLAQPALLFSDAAMAERIEALRARCIGFARRPPAGLDPAQHALLTAPEGTQLLLSTAE